jgi:hypothetical protein
MVAGGLLWLKKVVHNERACAGCEPRAHLVCAPELPSNSEAVAERKRVMSKLAERESDKGELRSALRISNQRRSAVIVGVALVLAISLAVLAGCGAFSVSPTLITINVIPAATSVAIGSTQQLTATGIFDDGTSHTLSNVTWGSTNSTIATVTSKGLLVGVAIGTTTVTATASNVIGSTTVNVTASPLVSLTIAPASATITGGQTQAFTATGTYQDGSTADLTNFVAWNSSNSAIAAITSAGIATAQTLPNVVSVNITASSGNIVSNTAVLTIEP